LEIFCYPSEQETQVNRVATILASFVIVSFGTLPSCAPKTDIDGETPVMRASEKGEIGQVKALLISANADLNLEDDAGRTAIAAAMENPERNLPEHQAAVIKLLKLAGAKD
jgi:hypothetical protein